MATKVQLTNRARTTRTSPTGSNKAELSLNRHTYQQLGSLIQNRNLQERYDNGDLTPEYMKTLDDFQKLNDGEESSQMMIDMDKYFGSLGMTETYKYSKDFKNIPPWITIEGQGDARNVVSGDILTITYNIVHNSGIETLNVIHRTGE